MAIWNPRNILSSLAIQEPEEKYAICISVTDLFFDSVAVLRFKSLSSLVALLEPRTLVQEGQALPLAGNFAIFNDDESSFILGDDEKNFEKLFIQTATYTAVRNKLLFGAKHRNNQEGSFAKLSIERLLPRRRYKAPVIRYYVFPTDVDMKIEFLSREDLRKIRNDIWTVAKDFSEDNDEIDIEDVNSYAEGWIVQDGGNQSLTWDCTRFHR